MRSTWLAAIAAAVALAAPTAAQANEVTHWNRIAMSTLVAFPGPAGGAPPALQIHMGMTQGAVYDALNAITPKHHRPYLLKRRFGATSSQDAAAATAAYRVLSSIVSGVPASIPFPNRAALLQALAAQYAASLAPIPNSPFKRRGIEAGNAAAEAMIAARTGDGRFGPSQWVPLVGPGYWQPLLNPDGTPALDPTPWVGGVRPFLLESPSQFRTAGPLPLASAAYAAEFNEVKALGSLNSAARTPEQTHIALYWQSAGGPALLWNDVASDLVEGGSLGMADSARLLGMMNLAAADAAINCWNDKYYYDFWRPWNAIPNAGTDGNPATDADPTWVALLTAPYPEHPSGHLCNDGAHLRVLQMFFGDDVRFGVTSSRFGGETRFFDHFSEPLAEIVEARIWAGLHFRTPDVQGALLGESVANYAAQHYFQSVGNH
jgi:PAP2 superfamily